MRYSNARKCLGTPGRFKEAKRIAANPAYRASIRVTSLELVAHAGDLSDSPFVETFLDSTETELVVAAIRTLSKLHGARQEEDDD